jgi:hypothetical protein
MDTTYKMILRWLVIAAVVILLQAGFFLIGRFTKKCPQVDPQLLEALKGKDAQLDAERQAYRTLADAYAAKADSIAATRKPTKAHVDKVLPTIPAGRSDAELDSIRAILLSTP